jgi:DNA helicase-2/ATP-dependent DNA helicase PcrA
VFPVLLHPDLYYRLRRSDRGERTRVWKTLLRLREGHWGGGTRVKRLRGVGRPVYEARTDSGDRLLFTVVRSADAEQPDRLRSHLQVWDLVEHDDAERVARRNRAPEAEFLELEPLEGFEITEPPPHPDALFADLAGDSNASTDPPDPNDPNAAAEPLLHFLLPPEGFAARAGEEVSGGIRWFLLEPALLAGEEEFQRMLDGGGDELELKLYREQYEILSAPGPVLLAGSAGSGKTTIAVHRLVAGAREAEPPSALYLSYSAPLVERARGLYRDLALARGLDPDRRPPQFFTFGDLYRSLIPRDLREHQTRPMTEALFRNWFRRQRGTSARSRATGKLDPALVWEELRSILKGACLAPSQPMLGEEAYFELGKKRAPLFIDERPEIYRIAQRYQELLAEEGRSDRIDLCRRALNELRRGKPRLWDVVICDEVQDLTELEVAFVLSLSRRPDLGGVLLTGDTQQIVNPSGFRWAEVRRLAGKTAHSKTAPAVLRLRRNLRSVRPLVDFANTLLLLRREVFGRTEEDEPEEAAIEGPLPIEISATEEEALAAIRGFGPRCAVLTLDDEEAERLRRLLDTTRVFHVREAKGLEFDTVVLWKLLTPDHDLAERFARMSAQSPQSPQQDTARFEKEARFKRLLQHLYVGVTRARRHLAVYEGPEPHPFWAGERFRGRLERDTVEGLAHLFQATASPDTWEAEGDFFLARGHFRQAAECYRRAARSEKETAALARADEEREDWAAALERWTRLDVPARQAPLLERLGRLSEALPLYRQAGMEREARSCELRLLERTREWAAAAAGWEEEGSFADAARCWGRAGDERRALLAGARGAEVEGRWSQAGEAWLELSDYDAAVRCFRAAGEPERAALALARRHEAEGGWARAAAAYRLAGKAPASLRCRARAHEATGRFDRAARAWERLGDTARALDLYARAGRWADVARLEGTVPEAEQRLLPHLRELVEAGDWRTAGPLTHARMEVLRPRLPDVPWFVFDEEQRLVWGEFCSLEMLQQSSEALRAEEDGAWSRASRCWGRAGNRERAAAALRRRIERVGHPLRRARAWVAVGDLDRALECLQTASGPAEAPEALLAVEAWRAEIGERWQEAADLWRSLGRERDESRCLARAARQDGDWTRAAHHHRMAGQERLATTAEKRARHPLPAASPRRET